MTGYKQTASQIKWLRHNGFKFFIGGDGKPRILKIQVEQILGISTSKQKRRAEPNEDALNAFMGLN